MNRAIAQLNDRLMDRSVFSQLWRMSSTLMRRVSKCLSIGKQRRSWTLMKLQLFDSRVSRQVVSRLLENPCMPSITTNELMPRLLDAEVLLVSLLDPDSSFPPNTRKIALHSDSLKRSITDGMYTVEDAEMIIEAAAELALVTEFYNRNCFTTWEEEHGRDDEDNNHDPVQWRSGPAS
jgi:hypothetical protein